MSNMKGLKIGVPLGAWVRILSCEGVVTFETDTGVAARALSPGQLSELREIVGRGVAHEADCESAAVFLEREGYRRCDAPACNCGSWHHHGAGL